MLPALYHAHHSQHLEDLPFWLALATQAGDPILELGCGTGRVLLPLAQAGHRCFGIDRDLGMLEFLRTCLDQKMQFPPYHLAADISQFCLAQQFALILLPCNTFSTLNADERQACLACVRRHLKPGGLFAFSLPNPDLWADLPASSAPQFEEEFTLPQTGNPVQVSSAWRRAQRKITVTWTYDQLSPDGTVQRLTMDSVQWLNPAAAYLEEVQSAGLQLMGVYGDFDRSNFEHDSPSLVILSAG